MGQLIGRETDRLDVDTHGIHLRQPDLDVLHLGAEVLELLPIHLLGQLVAELEGFSAQLVCLRFDQGCRRGALPMAVDVDHGTQVHAVLLISCTI